MNTDEKPNFDLTNKVFKVRYVFKVKVLTNDFEDYVAKKSFSNTN